MMKLLPSLILAASLLCVVFSGYSQMQCHWDYSWKNQWDGYHNNVQHNRYLSGMYSVHDNHREDRLFKWYYCEPNGLGTIQNIAPLTQTSYDAQWTRGCSSRNGGYAALVGAVSTHHNHYEDRLWTFYCGDIETSRWYFAPGSCSWTDYVNGWDAPVNYACPNNGVIRSISSYHHNHYEDRRWRFECCRVSDKQEGVSIPETYPENPLPDQDPGVPYPDDHEGDYYIFQFSSESMVYGVGGIICLLLLVNIFCLGYHNCRRGRKAPKYQKVAQFASSDDDMQNLKNNV